ncbi:hypothetical protein [Hymenobacter sp. BT730]|uniref:hypothetical protein n=1 Tax=Hymenobacter sp. BT730 TaxID=3063332 RepID=UPI0026E050EA|nr:hypothetical protein [Hymenobacter sp. BT730]
MKRFAPALFSSRASSLASSVRRHLGRFTFVGLLSLGLASAVNPAQAQQASPVSVESTDAESIRVRIFNPASQAGGRVQVVRVRNGHVLFDQAYSAAAYAHRFNFRQLPAGRYVLLMHVGPQYYRYSLEVQPNASSQSVVVRHMKARLPRLSLASAGL